MANISSCCVRIQLRLHRNPLPFKLGLKSVQSRCQRGDLRIDCLQIMNWLAVAVGEIEKYGGRWKTTVPIGPGYFLTGIPRLEAP
jgi:hypothetical protein